MPAPESTPPSPSPRLIRLVDLSVAQRFEALNAVAATLAGSTPVAGLAAMGYAAIAGAQAAAELLGLVSPDHADDPLHLPAWACPEAAVLREYVPTLTAAQCRTVTRLPSAQLLIRVGLEPDALARLLERLRLPPALVDDGEHVRVRLGSPGALGSVADRYRFTFQGHLAVVPLFDPATSPPSPATDAAAATLALEAAARRGYPAPQGVQLLDDGGPIPPLSPARPTILDLNSAGGVQVPLEGALSRRFILSQAGTTILFVCTGNTCRSPMAEAIAAGMLARQEPGVPVKVISAGVGASTGAPPTPEAVDALRELGYDPPRHTSRPVTRELLAQADTIYAMTRSHARSVQAMFPNANVLTLDPEGEDVPDPIGGPPSVYLQTAKRLEDLVSQRLKELHL